MGHDTVLLVEDNPDDVLLTERAFRRAGLVAGLQVVSDGEAARAYLAGEGVYAQRARYPLPVLILLDLKLPRLNGHELLAWRQGQERLKRLPVVVLTSSGEASDIERAYDLGANSYLTKPVAFESLLELIRALGLYWLVHNARASLTQDTGA